jgi:N-ethylmaleimide reductase
MQAIISVWGAERVGVRISPASHWQDITDSDPIALYTHVAQELAALGPLAYVHVVEPRDTGFGATADPVDSQLTAAFIRKVGGLTVPVLTAGGHDYKSGLAYLEDGKADAVVYGRWFIANPDLVKRFARGPDAPLNAYDR